MDNTIQIGDVRLKRVKVWQAPVRVLHWVHFFALLVLAITGFYIAHPIIPASAFGLPRCCSGIYLMGWVRFVHFVSAFIFTIAFIIRGWYFIFGNRYARFQSWFPVSKQRVNDLWRMLLFYTFIRKERPEFLGPNPVAGLAYLGIGFIILMMILTGFSLFGLAFPESNFWNATFGWLNVIFGAQTVRLVHRVGMYFFGAFLIVHIYLASLADVEGLRGEFSGIIGGQKFIPEWEDVS
jgi:Ni/Fe-hydrogenase 1 B-type cytochrome subunit